jgi:hypothetical protein
MFNFNTEEVRGEERSGAGQSNILRARKTINTETQKHGGTRKSEQEIKSSGDRSKKAF